MAIDFKRKHRRLRVFPYLVAKMAAGKDKITKQYLLDHLEDDEIDLSACELTSFPAKELVRCIILRGI